MENAKEPLMLERKAPKSGYSGESAKQESSEIMAPQDSGLVALFGA